MMQMKADILKPTRLIKLNILLTVQYIYIYYIYNSCAIYIYTCNKPNLMKLFSNCVVIFMESKKTF